MPKPLLLDGKPLTQERRAGPALNRVIAFLETLSDNEVVTLAEFEQYHLMSRERIKSAAKHHPALAPYSYLVPRGSGGGYYILGSKKAIAAAKRVFSKI